MVNPNAQGSAQSGQSACSIDLHNLYQAYLEVISGKRKVRWRASDMRELAYSEANLPELKAHFARLYAQCGEGSGIPDINDPSSASGVGRRRIGIVSC